MQTSCLDRQTETTKPCKICMSFETHQWHSERISCCAAQELLASYNIGINREKEQRQKLTDSARRVGLSIPRFNE